MIFTGLCDELVQFFYFLRQSIYMVLDDPQFLSLEFVEFESLAGPEDIFPWSFTPT